jgi:hypothetical protein
MTKRVVYLGLALLVVFEWAGHIPVSARAEASRLPGPRGRQDVYPYALMRYKPLAVMQIITPPLTSAPAALPDVPTDGAARGRAADACPPARAPGANPLYVLMSLQR